MNSLLSILLKNIILLALLVVSAVFVFTNFIGYKEVRYIFLGLGLCYVLASCFEAYKLSRIKKETKKFVYFPDGFIAKRFIKVIVFVCSGVVLYYSGSIIRYLSFLCFLIAFTEIVVSLWRYFNNLCFVAFEDGIFIMATNKLNTMFAADITKIEERHGLTYFVNTANTAFTVRSDMMKEKQEFHNALQAWVKKEGLQSKVAG